MCTFVHVEAQALKENINLVQILYAQFLALTVKTYHFATLSQSFKKCLVSPIMVQKSLNAALI